MQRTHAYVWVSDVWAVCHTLVRTSQLAIAESVICGPRLVLEVLVAARVFVSFIVARESAWNIQNSVH